MKRLAVGILAHVDSGKTTLSEGLLYCAGEIKKLGRVDHKDTVLDTDVLERRRGITIFSKQAILKSDDVEFTLLDTPGHVDFSAETERTLQIIDYAILVISASDGIQSHTETLWRLLNRYNIPTFIFVNKMDLPDTSIESCMKELKDNLSDSCVNFCVEHNSEMFYENISMCDEVIMESFLENEQVSFENIQNAIASRKVFPCYFGSARTLNCVDKFLSDLFLYTKSPDFSEEFGAKVFKITEDEQGNRLTHLKVTGGSLKVKSFLEGKSQGNELWKEKVNQIRNYSGIKYQSLQEAFSGMVCAVTGLTKTFAGEGLGIVHDSMPPILEPVLTYRVVCPQDMDLHTCFTKLKKLEDEEPKLNVIWNSQLQEINVQLMGEVQLEIIQSLLQERFNMNVSFEHGSIAYKETILEPVIGAGHYEPLRHYAEVQLLLEPTERGSGIIIESKCCEEDLNQSWQKSIVSYIAEKTHIGVLTGSPVTDIKITLITGRAHTKHTQGGDFRQAVYRAVRNGLYHAKSILLEPWYNFRLEVPVSVVGRAITDLQRMGGNFLSPEQNDDKAILCGDAPVSSMRGYETEVIKYTHGVGKLSCIFKGYEKCHNEDEIIKSINYDRESDLENTADSVFCSHGAGFVVKWNKVSEYLHTSCDEFKKREEYEDISESTESYNNYSSKYSSNSFEYDKELMDIFEKTYGKVKNDRYRMFETEKNTEIKSDLNKNINYKSGPEYLLVDGYNVIFSWENLKALAKDNLDLARSQLIHILCNYQGYKLCKVILVFDAYKVKESHKEIEDVNNISVVYTKEAETADMYIERASYTLGKEHRIRVVTSDGMEQLIILGNGAIRTSALEFQKEVEHVERDIRNVIENKKGKFQLSIDKLSKH